MTEETAIRNPLTVKEQEAVRAVDRAIDEIKHQRDGQTVLKIVEMVDFKRSHTIDGVALTMYMHRDTVGEKRSRFIYLVAKNLGWLEK